MTRDEVLDDVMEILRQEGYADQGETISRLRALKSKPPEKSPEVEDPKGQPINEALPEVLADLAESMASVLAKRQATNFISLGAVHPVLGMVEIRVQRCDGKTPTQVLSEMATERDALHAEADAIRQRYAEAQRERAETDALLIAANKRAHDAEAEVSRLKWEQEGAPQKGE